MTIADYVQVGNLLIGQITTSLLGVLEDYSLWSTEKIGEQRLR